MKRSKIFLGATASLLALAGIVAAKQQKHTSIVRYTTANNDCKGNTCTKIALGAVTTFPGIQRVFVAGGHLGCYTIGDGFCRPLYTGD